MTVGKRQCVVRLIARLNVGGPARHVAWLCARHRCTLFTHVPGTLPAEPRA